MVPFLPLHRRHSPKSAGWICLPKPYLHLARGVFLLAAATTFSVCLLSICTIDYRRSFFSFSKYKHHSSSHPTSASRPPVPHAVECAAASSPHFQPFLYKNSIYAPFLPPESTPPLPSDHLPVRPRISSNCRDAYFTLGTPCYSAQGSEQKIDVVWTWVNGSDPLHHQTLRQAEQDVIRTSRPQEKLFRDHDELRHSMRSVIQHLGPYLNTLHLISADYPFPFEDYSADPPLRVGQVPQWLDITPQSPSDRSQIRLTTPGWEWNTQNISLKIHHHAQFFKNYTGGGVFNSYAIEAQMVNLCGVADNVIYMNDDFFITADLKGSDFFSPHGPVLRLFADALVFSINHSALTEKGEWRQLEHSNWLISQRFGSRPRPYPYHMAKTISFPILHELTTMFNLSITETSTHAFRDVAAEPDLYVMFMHATFLVERWREALLWSFVVARKWNEKTIMEDMWKEVGGREGEAVLAVKEQPRVRPNVRKEEFEAAGWATSNRTEFSYSSMDGYPFQPRPFPIVETWRERREECYMNKYAAFGSKGGQEAIFKTVAFELPEVGDCIIVAIKNKSGMGLSGFLPFPYTFYPEANSSLKKETIPHLPMDDHWRAGDFGLGSVLSAYESDRGRGVDVRDWVLRLFERYQFVLGTTNTFFAMLNNPSDAYRMVKDMQTSEETTMLCMNDDVDQLLEVVDGVLREWQGRRWGTPAPWEA